MLPRTASLTTLTALVTLAASAPAGAAATVLRHTGIGPLKLGMTMDAARATGWLSNQGTGCELGGPPLPVTFSLRGSKAPAGLRGTVEFQDGKLRVMSFTRGVRTTTGVTVGRTTPARMVSSFRKAGYLAAARFDDTFQGTFVTVRKRRLGRQYFGAFASGRVIDTLAVPYVPTCE